MAKREEHAKPLDVAPEIEPDPSGVHGSVYRHPAYGNVAVFRTSGRTKLHGVHYPQQHFMTIEVSTASMRRNLSNDWHGPDDTLVQFQMSEVQWAAFVASAGQGGGTPCTLTRYTKPGTGERMWVQMHDEETRKELFMQEAQDDARECAEALDKAREIAKRMAEGGSVRKSDVAELTEQLRIAHARLSDGIPWVLQQADEAIDEAITAAKAEMEAHAAFTMQRLGKEALAALDSPDATIKRVQLKPRGVDKPDE